jgi:hypothetical protein
VSTVLPLARRAVLFEVALYRSLFRWVTRRPDRPAGSEAFGYVGAVAVLLWAFIVMSAVELVVLHVILPWEKVRLLADVAGIWGLLWMLGFTASFHVYPHLVGESGLRVRHGHGIDFHIPWDAIERISVRERSHDSSKTVQVDHDDNGTELRVVVGSRTNVDVVLRRPVTLRVRGVDEAVTVLRFYADDARGLVAVNLASGG